MASAWNGTEHEGTIKDGIELEDLAGVIAREWNQSAGVYRDQGGGDPRTPIHV